MRQYKIGIVGPESTGKSALALALAQHYKTEFVPEMARVYLENLGRDYDYPDLKKIAQLQMQKELELGNANELLICDTSLLVLKIWSEFKYNKVDAYIDQEESSNRYDLYLLTNIDLPWENDPLREHPNDRAFLFDLYHNALIEKKCTYEIVTGNGPTRLWNACKLIDHHFNLLTNS